MRLLAALMLAGTAQAGVPDGWAADVQRAASAPLRVGTSGDYPPFSTRHDDGTYEGFDIEVAKAYAADRGFSVEFVQFSWPELQARMTAEIFDVAMGGITVRGDRLALAPMTSTVARTEVILVTRAGAAGTTRHWTSPVVAVNGGGHLEQVARARLPRATVVSVDGRLRLATLLTLGEVDAIVTDTLEGAPFLPSGESAVPSTGFETAQVLGHDRRAYWVTPRAAALVDDLDRWIGERERDGWLDRLRLRFFGAPPAHALPPALARVTDLMGRRLMLMPAVAWAKQASGRQTEDVLREDMLERAALKAAKEMLIDEAGYLNLVRVQFAVAKMVQKAALSSRSTHTGRSAEDGQRELIQVLRPAIDRIDRGIVLGLTQVSPLQGSVEDIMGALRADAPVPGLDDAALHSLAEAVMRLTVGRSGQVPVTSR